MMIDFKLVYVFSLIAAVNCFYNNDNVDEYFNAVDSCVSELNLPIDQVEFYRYVRNPKNQNQSDVLCCTYKKIKWVVNDEYSPDNLKKLIDVNFKMTHDKIRRQKQLATIDVCGKIVQSKTDICSFVGNFSSCLRTEMLRYDLRFLKELCVEQLNITKEKFNSYNLEGALQTREEKCALACLWKYMRLIHNGKFSTEVAYRRMRIIVPNNSTILADLMEVIEVCAKDVQNETDECSIAGIVGPCFFKKLNELQAKYPDATDNEITDETSTQRKPSKRHISPKFQRTTYSDALLGLFGYSD